MAGINKICGWLVVMCTASTAFAFCSDDVVADCGEFKVLMTTCLNPNSAGMVDQDLSALFHDSTIGKVALYARPTEELNVYHGVINGETDVYLAERPEATGLQAQAYFAYTVADGKRGPLMACRD